jgi:phage shock protein PspC (stress-responsive transcriptional regulator)
MKEITRIHIAKTVYDIEIDAKKDIQKYIAALDRYANDAELLDDIEIRITELLAERNVQAGGVIAKDDVAAVRAQLGEPSDFAPDDAGDIAIGDDAHSSERRLYRDTDSAVLGGVLSGIARYFKIDPVWTRVLFIIILLLSFGTASIVYLVLWLVVPAARTAAQKLQMRGQPVTVESIKRLGERDVAEDVPARIMRQIIRYGVGAMLIVGAIGALVATVWAVLGLTLETAATPWRPFDTWWTGLALGLFIVAGVLLAALGFILADATFRKRWSKKIGIGVVSIIVAGVLAFVGGVTTLWYGSWQENAQYESMRKVSTEKLSAKFAQIKKLEVTGGDLGYASVDIEYVVSSTPRYELDALPGVKANITLSDDGTTAKVAIKGQSKYKQWNVGRAHLKIYGPALERVTALDTGVRYQNASTQEYIAIHGDMGRVTIVGSYKEVRVTSTQGRALSLD